MNLLATDEQVSAEINPTALLSLVQGYAEVARLLLVATHDLLTDHPAAALNQLDIAAERLAVLWDTCSRLTRPPVASHQGTAIGDDNR